MSESDDLDDLIAELDGVLEQKPDKKTPNTNKSSILPTRNAPPNTSNSSSAANNPNPSIHRSNASNANITTPSHTDRLTSNPTNPPLSNLIPNTHNSATSKASATTTIASNNPSRVTATTAASSTANKSRPISTELSDDEDGLNSLLQDIDDSLASQPLTATKLNLQAAPAYSSQNNRCYPVYLTNLSNTGCKKMLCSACDLQIVKIANSAWQNDCDYMFFRNNTPNLSKLKAKTIPTVGSAAYCCQCCWVSIDKPQVNTNTTKLKWNCLGH
jgi:hypothetical protein